MSVTAARQGRFCFLKDVSCEFSACSMGSWRMVWVHLPACGWVSWPAVSSLGVLLVYFLCLLLRCSGALGAGWFTSMVEDGGCGDKLSGPTADTLPSSISCGLPMLGVRPSICIGEMGSLELLGAGIRAQKARRLLSLRKKIYSRGFAVISVLLRVFTVRSRCTVLVVLF